MPSPTSYLPRATVEEVFKLISLIFAHPVHSTAIHQTFFKNAEKNAAN